MMSKKEVYQAYNDMLNELYPLDGIACNCFSTLLECGDPIAYDCGFTDWCDLQNWEIE